MSGIIGSYHNIRGSGIVNKLGTDGQVFTSTGVGGAAGFEDAAGGGSMTFLATQTASDTCEISFDGYFTSDYAHYKFIYSVRADTANTDTAVRFRQGDADVTATDYWYAGMGMYVASGAIAANSSGAIDGSYIKISSSDNTASAAYPCTGELILFNALSTSLNKTITTTSIGYNSNDAPNAIRAWTYAAQLVSTTALTGFSFLYDGGNITGTVRLYGIKNS